MTVSSVCWDSDGLFTLGETVQARRDLLSGLLLLDRIKPREQRHGVFEHLKRHLTLRKTKGIFHSLIAPINFRQSVMKLVIEFRPAQAGKPRGHASRMTSSLKRLICSANGSARPYMAFLFRASVGKPQLTSNASTAALLSANQSAAQTQP